MQIMTGWGHEIHQQCEDSGGAQLGSLNINMQYGWVGGLDIGCAEIGDLETDWSN